jgi:hypothetical protein
MVIISVLDETLFREDYARISNTDVSSSSFFNVGKGEKVRE